MSQSDSGRSSSRRLSDRPESLNWSATGRMVPGLEEATHLTMLRYRSNDNVGVLPWYLYCLLSALASRSVRSAMIGWLAGSISSSRTSITSNADSAYSPAGSTTSENNTCLLHSATWVGKRSWLWHVTGLAKTRDNIGSLTISVHATVLGGSQTPLSLIECIF